jgi:ubiquinone/menaquinone biosynthesis C-methylase UbiE
VSGANAPDPQLSIVSVVLRAIGSGMKVLDLACGVEDVSVLVARMAGESGAVLVD